MLFVDKMGALILGSEMLEPYIPVEYLEELSSGQCMFPTYIQLLTFVWENVAMWKPSWLDSLLCGY